MTDQPPELVPGTLVPAWAGRAARVAVLAAVTGSTFAAFPAEPAAIRAAAAVALAVAIAATVGTVVFVRSGLGLIAFTVAGLAGAALSGLIPASAGFVLGYLALIGLGILAPPRQALAGGIVVFVAMIVAVGRGTTRPDGAAQAA